MAEFPTYIPGTWTGRVTPAIEAWLEKMQNHPTIIKYIAYYGAANIDALTQLQKGATFSAFQLWAETKRFEKDPAVQTAANTVDADFDTNFIL